MPTLRTYLALGHRVKLRPNLAELGSRSMTPPDFLAFHARRRLFSGLNYADRSIGGLRELLWVALSTQGMPENDLPVGGPSPRG